MHRDIQERHKFRRRFCVAGIARMTIVRRGRIRGKIIIRRLNGLHDALPNTMMIAVLLPGIVFIRVTAIRSKHIKEIKHEHKIGRAHV